MVSGSTLSCPALLIAGCASGQGKTTVTAALARYHARAGRRVRVFKTGPDFIDPMILEAASGAPGLQRRLLDGGRRGLARPACGSRAGRRPDPRRRRNAAFSFLYRANFDCLAGLGAETVFFSPLADEAVPPADALYLPGGYPELHAARLSGNRRWLESLRAFAAAQRPLLAECGGMMVLFDHLVTCGGSAHAMAGLLPGTVTMRERLAAIGLQSLALPEGELRGHTFHYSQLDTPLEPAWRCTPHGRGAGEHVYRCGSITASYLHTYFPSNPAAIAALFRGAA